jgi:hypothetical protein
MNTLGWVAFFVVFIIIGIGMNDHKRNLCEHEGLGKWHYYSQVCEPLRP